jgi:hypothetical protein
MSLDPFDSGTGPPPNLYRYREADLNWTEKKYGDNEMLGVWQSTDLPEDAVVTHVTLIPYRGEKAVVGYRNGRMLLPEGEVAPGEDVDAVIRRAAAEQAGITELTYTELGHMRCRATVYSKTQEPGTITYRAVYGVDVGAIGDFPTDPAYERRIILQREMNTLIRDTYIEMRKEYTEALDRFLLDRLKANLRGDAVGS